METENLNTKYDDISKKMKLGKQQSKDEMKIAGEDSDLGSLMLSSVDFSDFPDAFNRLNKLKDDIKRERKDCNPNGNGAKYKNKKTKSPNPVALILNHALGLIDEKETRKLMDSCLTATEKRYKEFRDYCEKNKVEMDFIEYLAKAYDPKKLQ